MFSKYFFISLLLISCVKCQTNIIIPGFIPYPHVANNEYTATVTYESTRIENCITIILMNSYC